jgi:hypothetical protein
MKEEEVKMENKNNVYRNLVGKYLGRRPLRRLTRKK